MSEVPQDQATLPGKPILSYFRRLFVAVDQLINAILGGNEDETISSRVGKDARRGKPFACVLCRALHWIDPFHCEKAIERDRGKRPGQFNPPATPFRSDWS